MCLATRGKGRDGHPDPQARHQQSTNEGDAGAIVCGVCWSVFGYITKWSGENMITSDMLDDVNQCLFNTMSCEDNDYTIYVIW